MSAPSPAVPSPARIYRPDLDGLRAVAVLAVLVHHVAPAALPGGFAGVDVFFVLSGYLITGILADELAAGAFRWPAFLLRRARRLLPALVTVLVATLAGGALLLTGPEYASLARHVIAATLSGANVLLWREVGYFDTEAAAKPLLHLWSLGVEEQFYLVWPALLVLLARPSRQRARTALVTGLAVASFALAMPLAWSDAAQAFYLLPARAWELLAGALLALVPRDPTVVGWWRRQGMTGGRSTGDTRLAACASWSGALLVVLGLVTASPEGTWPGPRTLLPVAGTVLLIAAGPHAMLNRTMLAWRGATWLGLRSYPLYLWHWPLLALLHVVRADLALSDAVVRALAIAAALLAVALAHLTYVGIERPLQRRVAARIGARAPQLRDLRPFAISLVAVACAALLIVRANGVPARYVAGVRDEVAVLRAADRALVDAAQQASVRCVPEAQTRQGSWCFRRDHAPPRIAILGDSHAEALYATLVTALPRDAGPLLVGRPGCAPTLLPTVAEADSPEARNRARCHRAVRLALDLIEHEPTVHTVLLASRGAFQVTGTAFGHETGLPILPVRSDAARPDTARLVALWVEGMARTIARLQATGRRVILVVDHPELGFDPRSCVTGRPLGLRSVRTPCAIPRAALDARTAGYRAAIDELARRIPGLERYDTVEPLCDARWCRAYVDGALLYHDDDHLSRAGADRVFTPLARRLHGEMAQVASRH